MDIEPLLKQSRPGWALVILAAPVVLFAVVVLLYSGMFGMALQGRAADGEPIELTLATCEEALPVLQARLDDIGLPSEVAPVQEGQWRLSTQGTGRVDVDQALPAALVRAGRFELRHGSDVLFTNDGVREATYRLDGMMDMWLLLMLDDDATDAVVGAVRASKPGDRLVFVIDGEELAMQPTQRSVARGEVEGIPLAEIDQKTRMRLIAEWSMQIDNPLPCGVELLAGG